MTKPRLRGRTATQHRIYQSTNGRCYYCAQPLVWKHANDPRDWLLVSSDDRRFTREHKIPMIRGGTNSRDNYVPSCARCNFAKGRLTTDEYRTLCAFRSGSLNFVFPFETPKTNQRDWLCCQSPEFERDLVIHNMPAARDGFVNSAQAWAAAARA